MLKSELKQLFGTSNLYKILDVVKTCDQSQLKKAYRQKSLELHPDKQSEDKENYTAKFQQLHKIFTLLSNTGKRQLYDEQGVMEENEMFTGKADWSDYWRELFYTVTKDDIDDMEKDYKGSQEEVNDVAKWYKEAKGDMDRIMESIMLIRYDEEDRIRVIIDNLIKTKQVKKYKTYANEPSRKRKNRERRGKREEEEFLKAQAGEEESGSECSEGEESLEKAIALNQKDRKRNIDAFIDGLEAKYSQPTKKRKKR